MDLSAPLAPGWALANCSGPVQASLLFRWYNSEGMPVAEAGVNAATVPATRFVTFAEQGEGKNGTGVAYANPSDTAALVTFTARDADGEVLAIEDQAAPDSLSARVVEPSGLTSDGTPVLGDLWFAEHETAARKGLRDFPGAMELRFALHEPINESQIELLKAIQSAEIQTFGWPIGIVLDAEEWKPKPVEDGIVAEVAITENDGISGSPSYDYWAIRKNGDFFLLQSLFEDQRREKVMFVDTRVVRVTEALMFCERLYKALGVADDAKVSIEVVHRGLAGRVLSVASSRRHILPAKSASDVGRAQVVVPVSDLGPHLTDYVVQIVEPLLMLFDFRQLNRKVYEGLVTDFANGRIG